MVSTAGPIGAPIGATTTTGHIVVVAATIQRTSGLATADSGETTDTLTRRGGRSERGKPAEFDGARITNARAF